MMNYENMEHFPTSEKLVSILCNKTQNNNPLFFRILVGYYFSKVASMMRTNIRTHDRGVIPVNMYAINLAGSGAGKGHSTNILEEEVIDQFKNKFLEGTFLSVSTDNIYKIANTRSVKKATDPDEEKERADKEFNQLGALAFSFDSATTPAVKQMRQKLLMANCGSLNLHIDEIGSNLLGNMDVLNTFLELFDIGKVKNKLTKNTNDNTRYEEIEGKTPTNMMLFGTPSKLLNGGKTEEEFYSILEAGLARRCLFGFSRIDRKIVDLTAEEIYEMSTNEESDKYLSALSLRLGKLADRYNFNKSLTVTKEVSLLNIEYRIDCEKRAAQLPAHDEMRKAELCHRYFKALKLAGTYAFIDGMQEIRENHLHNAIRLTEDSGEAFSSLLTRERNYVKLANYIASVQREITHVDLIEDLPFYKGTSTQKQELMNLAIAHGYKNNIIIKRIFNNNIEFLKGESLEKTNLDKMIISYGKEFTENYGSETVPFNKLHMLTQKPHFHWVNHALHGGYRDDGHCISGFNLIVIDVDNGTSLKVAKNILKEYKYLIHTTKRHTEEKNRFRIIMPANYILKMEGKEYKEFMKNLFEWLPFEVDEQTNQRSRKWGTYTGDYWYNEGEPIDVLPFIPKTSKNEERKNSILSLNSLTNLERWFVNNSDQGNRNNQLIKYALMLVDSGMDIETVKNNVLSLNSKLPSPLEESEIISTILITAAKASNK